MKKIITILVLTFTSAIVFAQSPQKVSYQAVVRNATGTLVALKPVGLRFSIIQTTEFGASIFVETQTSTTNVNGLFSTSVGSGTAVLGSFATINWANGPYFLKTEIDPDGGTSYSISGTQQLMSVPYALYTSVASKAMVADSLNPAATITPAQIKSGSALTDQYLRWNGNNWAPNSLPLMTAGNGIGIDNGKIGSQWNKGILGPYTDSLQVGIGTSTPYSKLHISGTYGNLTTTTFEGEGYNTFYRYGRYLGYLGSFSDSNTIDFGGSGAGVNVSLVTSAYPRLTVNASTGYVGINTTTPASTLEVNGSTKTTNFQMTSGAGTGKVMTSDASGNASWANMTGRISNFVSTSGLGNNPSTTNGFIGQTVTLTITAGQKVFVSVSKAMGSTAAGGANSLNLYMGYQLTSGTTPTNQGSAIFGLQCAQNTKNLYTMQWTYSGLAAGTYYFGMTGSSSNAANWNNNEYSYITALVID